MCSDSRRRRVRNCRASKVSSKTTTETEAAGERPGGRCRESKEDVQDKELGVSKDVDHNGL